MTDKRNIERLISLLFKTERAIRESQRGSDIDHDMMLRCTALRVIADESPAMKRVAESLRIKAPSATALVQGLVKAGYVRRKPGKSDKREVCMTITAAGKKYLDTCTKAFSKRLEQALAPLSDSQIKSFIEILDRIKSEYERKTTN